MKTQHKRLGEIALVVSVLLLVPLIAMQFTNEVSWTLFDFLIAGALLFGTGLVLNLILMTVKSKQNRILLGLVSLVVLILIWIELAVGIFGTPLAGN